MRQHSELRVRKTSSSHSSIAPMSSPSARKNLGDGFETTAHRSFCSTCWWATRRFQVHGTLIVHGNVATWTASPGLISYGLSAINGAQGTVWAVGESGEVPRHP